MIPAGQRNQRIQIQAATVAQDGLGQLIETWAEHVTLWARARPLRGREFVVAAAVQSEGPVVFGFNWRGDITTAMRVLWRGLPHAIVAEPIDVDGGRHTLELVCSSGPRAGAAA